MMLCYWSPLLQLAADVSTWGKRRMPLPRSRLAIPSREVSRAYANWRLVRLFNSKHLGSTALILLTFSEADNVVEGTEKCEIC